MTDITNELTSNILKKRVEKIRNDRQILITKIVNLLYSDIIFIKSNQLKKEFRKWIIENKIIEPYNYDISIKGKGKKRRKVRSKKHSEEYIILCNLEYRQWEKNPHEIKFSSYSDHGLNVKCPYTNNGLFYIIELNGEIWLKYEIILNKILKAIPLYQQFFYQAELLRLCDKKFTHICEKCGSKNEKCAIYCNICGVKLNEE